MVGKSCVCSFLSVRHLLGDGIESPADVFGERRDGVAEPFHLDIEPATPSIDCLRQFLELLPQFSQLTVETATPSVDCLRQYLELLRQFLQLTVETSTVSVQLFFEYRHS